MKIRVAVLFGGISVEHEVSVISGLQAFHALDRDTYEPIPVFITKKGEWYTGEVLTDIKNYQNQQELLAKAEQVVLEKDETNKPALRILKQSFFSKKAPVAFDVCFPVLHGSTGEDGSIQGQFELLGIPYVGCDVLSSAVGMDKIVMKQVLQASNVAVVKYDWFYRKEWEDQEPTIVERLENTLGYPMVVKPANLGSSVGISRAKNREELIEAVELAASFALKIIVEEMVQNLTEINCSVLGDYEEAQASICEEVMGSDEILTYSDKYESNPSKGMSGTSRKIPAEISEEATATVQKLALDTFRVLGCSGVSRIDFLMNKTTGEIYVNEINTIPGSLSFYLWEPTGKSFDELTSDLVRLAVKRERERKSLTATVDSNLFSLHGGAKGGKLGIKG
ncbi:MAG: D-alanine--D-alanine ligase family protein [Bacilli bacterium]